MTAIPAQTSLTSQSVLWEQIQARLGVFLATYLTVMVIGAGVVILLPNWYEGSSELEVVGPDGNPRPLSVVSADSYRSEVRSSEVFERAEKRLRGEGASADYETLRRLNELTVVTTVPDKGRVVITAGSGSPQEAARLANAMAEAYREVQGERAEASRKRHEPELKHQRELEESVKGLTAQRDGARSALTIYDEASRGSFGHEGDLAAARKDLETQVNQAQADQANARVQVQGLTETAQRLEKELIDTPELTTEQSVTITPNPARTALQVEIAQLERELSSMLLRLTEKHPEVIQKRATIEQKKADLAKMDQKVEDTTTVGKRPNPVYVQLKDSLEQTKGRLQQAEYTVKQKADDEQKLKARLVELDGRVTERKKLAETLAQAEGRLSAAAQELSKLNDQLGVLQAGLVVPELVKRAEPPQVPAGPLRGAWMVPVFAVSVLGAVGATFAVPLMDRTFASGHEVGRFLKLPVVGTVTRIESGARRRVRRVTRRTVQWAVVLLVGAGAALVGVLLAFPTLTQTVHGVLFKN